MNELPVERTTHELAVGDVLRDHSYNTVAPLGVSVVVIAVPTCGEFVLAVIAVNAVAVVAVTGLVNVLLTEPP